MKNPVKHLRRSPGVKSTVGKGPLPLDAAVVRILDALPQQVAVISASGVVRFANHAWCDYGADAGGGLLGQGVGDNYLRVCDAGCAEGERFATAIRAVLQGELDGFSLEYACPAGDHQRWFIGHVGPYPGGGALISHEEVTELKLAAAAATELAHFDPLTGLPNRLLMADRLHQALAQAEREGWQLAVLFLDLDRFKTINDTLGHAAGDHLIKGVTERLRGCVRRSDTVARFAGDEFVVALVPVTHSRDITRVARKILATLADPFLLFGEAVCVTASIGVAIFPADGHDGEMLLHHADLAMYRAKERGGNAFQYFTAEMNLQAARQLAMENTLRRAFPPGMALLPAGAGERAAGGAGESGLEGWGGTRGGAVDDQSLLT